MHQFRALKLSALAMMICFVSLALFPGTSFAAGGPNYYSCTPTWHYDNISHVGNSIASIGPTLRDYNGTGNNAVDTFTATVSGTVSLTVSENVTIDVNFLAGKVSSNTGISVSTSLTASVGNQTQITVPPGLAGYAQYGVWRVVTTGHYYYTNNRCYNVDYGTMTVYSPWYVGWNTWTAS